MDEHGYAIVHPASARPVGAPGAVPRPQVRLRAALDRTSFPKQGATRPWRLHQNYVRDVRLLKHGPVDDEMDFARAPAREETAVLIGPPG